MGWEQSREPRIGWEGAPQPGHETKAVRDSPDIIVDPSIWNADVVI